MAMRFLTGKYLHIGRDFARHKNPTRGRLRTPSSQKYGIPPESRGCKVRGSEWLTNDYSFTTNTNVTQLQYEEHEAVVPARSAIYNVLRGRVHPVSR